MNLNLGTATATVLLALALTGCGGSDPSADHTPSAEPELLDVETACANADALLSDLPETGATPAEYRPAHDKVQGWLDNADGYATEALLPLGDALAYAVDPPADEPMPQLQVEEKIDAAITNLQDSCGKAGVEVGR